MATFDVALYDLVTAPVADTGKMTKKLAVTITGGLSNPSKMPGHAWGTPMWNCITGSKLVHVKGSVCENCYAGKLRFTWPNVKLAYQRRLERMYHPRWVEAMVYLINDAHDEYFRFQDSGDLQSIEQLRNIVAVCVLLPLVKFWLPTREYKIVQDYLKLYGPFPSNLVVRLSAHMKDAASPSGYGLPTSTVHTSEDREPVGAKVCYSYRTNHECRDCRACWNSNVPNVSYLEH